AGALDHGAVGDRIGERHAQLDDVGAGALGGRHQPARLGQRGIAGREVRHQRALAARAQPRERRLQPWSGCRTLGESRGWPGRGTSRLRPHPTAFPRALATTWTSLSPRPERPTTIVFARGSVLASRMAWATAWADS